MTTDTAERLRRMPGVRATRRPVTPGGAAEFNLHHVRLSPPQAAPAPILVLPGGPGLASVLPYARLRAEAAARGLDVLMVEHRGIGLSRTDDQGRDLPPEALTVTQVVDDLAAVLDDHGLDRVVVYGCSYGTYLAQGLGVRHPERVAGMVLDSPMLTAHDSRVQRAELRRRYLDTRGLRELLEAGTVAAEETGEVIQLVHEYGGPAQVRRLLDRLATGRGQALWRWLHGLGGKEITENTPYFMEFDLAGVPAFRELGYAPDPDGLPLDVNLSFAQRAKAFPAFAGEPFDLPAELPGFTWPVAVLSGERDLRTPRVIAAQIADLAPDGVLVPLNGIGHSALDSHPLAALTATAAVAAGNHRHLPALAARLSALPRPARARTLELLLRARLSLPW
ncbi:alpha/beta hydrolase [Crossiella sp. SN42]|uniref:alpha/beta hydrolase n=1 Tax=Crossiella sp. SN42 TaxID=2944808 RepID=UPI0027DEB0B1|nr:alpha/beta hydrolase [Crossiella sp. SN42]